MNKKWIGNMVILFGLVLIITFVVFKIENNNAYATGLEVIGSEFGISIVPNTPPFAENNMSPGDNATAIVKIRNDGKAPFSFVVQAEKQSGDDMLFERLTLEITKVGDSKPIYSGLLKEVNPIQAGSIQIGGAADLSITIGFPAELGNEFQGKTLSLKWVFTATEVETATNGQTVITGQKNYMAPNQETVATVPEATKPGTSSEASVLIEPTTTTSVTPAITKSTTPVAVDSGLKTEEAVNVIPEKAPGSPAVVKPETKPETTTKTTPVKKPAATATESEIKPGIPKIVKTGTKNESSVVINPELIPGSSRKLPKTGGIPDIVFFGFGVVLISSGAVLRKKVK